MAVNLITNTFKKLDTDTSFNKQDNSNFYDGVDLRLISDEALSNGALVNFKGTKAKINLGDKDCIVKGYTTVNNVLILLLYYNVASPYSCIATVELANTNTVQPVVKVYSDLTSTVKLGFNTVDSISAIGRYESEYSKKVYFAVAGQPLRYFNVVQSSMQTYSASFLDIIPNIGSGYIDESATNFVDGGNLLAGKVQYAFRLFKRFGAETSFSLPSNFISITESSPKNTLEFTGSDIETSVSKSISLTISGLTTTFDYIRLYAIHYPDRNTPTISLISEVEIPSTGEVTIIDNGSKLEAMTIEEYNSFGGRVFSATEIASKNNALFAANIIEESSDIDIDCRAYRFKPSVNPTYQFDYTLNSVLLSNAVLTIKEEFTGVPPQDYYFTINVPIKATILESLEAAKDDFLSKYGPDGSERMYNATASITGNTLTMLMLPGTTYYELSKYSGPASFVFTGLLYTVGTSEVFDASTYKYVINVDGDWEKRVISDNSLVDSDVNWSLPETADCINKYNDEFLMTLDDNSTDHPYPYNLAVTPLSVTPTIGGTGKHVSYRFLTTDAVELIDVNHSTVVSEDGGSPSYKHIISTSSYKQGEVYRFGVTFYDLKGKPYFTKWIGDIRIPYRSDIFNVNPITDVATVKNINIEFTVNLSTVSSDIISKISAFNISVVERTQADQSIVCQGATWIAAVDSVVGGGSTPFPLMHKTLPLKIVDIGSGVYTYNSGNEFEKTSGQSNSYIKDYVHPLHSPELYFNNGIDSFSSNYIVKLVRAYVYKKRGFDTVASPSYSVDVINAECSDFTNQYTASLVLYPHSVLSSGNIVNASDAITSTIGASYNVTDSVRLKRMTSGSSPVTLQYGAEPTTSVQFYNRTLPANKNTSNIDTHMTGYGPSCGLFTTSVPIAKRSGYDYVYIVDVYKNNASSRYGGNTYQARSLNVYNPATAKVLVSSATSYVCMANTGDSFNTIFDAFSSYIDPNIADQTYAPNFSNVDASVSTLRQQSVILLPVESKINCALSSIKPSKYILNRLYSSGKSVDEPNGAIALQDTTSNGVELFGELYPAGIPDCIKYNIAYSAVAKYPTLITKPTFFEESSIMPSTIIASEIKLPGEIVDSWTKFLYNNVLDLDSQFGSINNLQHFNNRLYFFQEDAIGVAAVNERYVLNQDSPGQLALGTGGILERFDYIKYNEGITDHSHIIATNDSIYYLDARRGVLSSIDSKSVPMSIEHGVNSLIRSLYTDDSIKVTFGYNPRFKEVLFTIGSKTLVFNENYYSFAPRHSYVPNMYLSLPNELLSFTTVISKVNPTTNYVFRHDVGDYGEVYSENTLSNTTRSESLLTFIVNPGNTRVMNFDSIDFRTEVYASGESLNDGDIPYETISSIDFRNSYQYTSKTIVPKDGINTHPNASRLARRWATTVPLVQDSSLLKDITGNGKRMVDTFLMVTLRFANNASKKFRLHDVITRVR